MPPIVAEGAHAVRLLAGDAATRSQAVVVSDPGSDLSSAAEYDLSPDISGTRVVWWRYPGQIALHDLVSGQTQTIEPPAGASNLIPSIDGDHVVFARLPSAGDWQILVYDITNATEHQIATYPRDYGLGTIRISGNRIVWHSHRAQGWDIYLYDLATGTGEWLTSDPADDADPDVDGHFVVWLRASTSGCWDVWLRDLDTGTETRLTEGTAGRAPRISGDRVVWGDTRGGSFSLYEYSLITGASQQVPTLTEMENSLTLDGHRMAWVNRSDDPNRAFYDDIFVYDFDTAQETRLTALPVRQWFPELSGNRLVWLDERTGSSHVFLFDLPSLSPAAFAVDSTRARSGTSDLNGSLEPGETVSVVSAWRNGAAADVSFTGRLVSFVGPEGFAYSVVDGSASYGAIPAGGSADCSPGYTVGLSTGHRPAAHVDATASEVLSNGQTKSWTVHVGDSFTDIGRTHWAYRFIETLLHSGSATGCSPTEYCPGLSVNRWQTAVFVAQALTGRGRNVPARGTVPGRGDYDCIVQGTSVFTDVRPDDPGCRFIHYLAARGITAGCSSAEYCPSIPLDRGQMAVLLAAALTGGAVPAAGSVPGLGPFDCRPGGVSVFADVAPEEAGCRFIHYLAAQGITAGCGNGDYCPGSAISRDQMAVFMTTGFKLSLYGP